MATDDFDTLLKAGIQAARSGNRTEARRLLEKALEKNENSEQAWMALASVVETPRERRICLEQVLEINPNNERAKSALEKLGPSPITGGTGMTPVKTPTVTDAPDIDLSRTATPKPRTESRPEQATTYRVEPKGATRAGTKGGPGGKAPARRRRMNPVVFGLGVALSIVLIGVGVILLINTTSAPPTPTAKPTISAADLAQTQFPTTPSATPQIFGTVVTIVPNLNFVSPTWTRPPTLAYPTATPTATLPPIFGYSLAFVSEGSGIYSVNGDGSNEKLLTSTDPTAFDPAWSPDGKQIAYAGTADKVLQIFVADFDGSQAKAITAMRGKVIGPPTWSPDGKQIAFASDDTGIEQIYTINTDGTGLVNISNNTVRNIDPAWSPDGSTLVFASDVTGKKSLQIVSYDFKSGKTTQLTQSQNNNYSPAWSPDGKQIAFVSTRDPHAEVYTMFAIDGSNQQLLTYGDADAESRDPIWSPDGRWIFFSSNRNGGTFNIFAATPNGRTVQQVTNRKQNTYSPRFRP